jgi:ribosome-associated heat shock protein Hsp15
MAKEKIITPKVRLDKYLWAIRIFKTRSLAVTACDKGKVKLNSNKLKASYSVKIGDEFTIEISHQYSKIIQVVQLLEKRQSASAVKDYFIDNSPPYIPLEVLPDVFYSPPAKRARGSGRPTKKEGRDIRKMSKD